MALLVVALAACEVAPSEPEGLGPQAGFYLDFALDLMEDNSIRRYEVDWATLRAEAHADAGTGRAPADTYDAIERAVARLGDDHSFFSRPSEVGRTPSSQPSPSAAVVGTGIAYLDVPAFEGGGAMADSVATVYHDLIESVDSDEVCRWVVDLRGNTGGNMWPMLAGVGPILGEGTAGFFVDPDSVVNEWGYENGMAELDGAALASVSAAYELERAGPSIAVLTDASTASSGEAIAVAFRGRSDARSFGEPTFGVSTVNAGFLLPDGAVLFLTVAATADRTGEVYGSTLAPDSVVEGTKSGVPGSDAALDAAIAWLGGLACA